MASSSESPTKLTTVPDPANWSTVVEAVTHYVRRWGGANDVQKLREAALLLDFTFGDKVRGRSFVIDGGRDWFSVVEILFHGQYRMILIGDNTKIKVHFADAKLGMYTRASQAFSGADFRWKLLAYIHGTIAGGSLLVVNNPDQEIEIDIPSLPNPAMFDFPEDDDI